MNGTSPSRFPKNTSAGTFDRIFDAAAKGQSIRDASVDYRGSLTWLTETIYEVSGRDYHAQDEDKKTLSSQLIDAFTNTTFVKDHWSPHKKCLVSDEVKFKDEEGIERFFRVVIKRIDPKNIFFSPYESDAIRIYQYDRSCDAETVLREYYANRNDTVKRIYEKVLPGGQYFTWSPREEG